MTGPKRIQRGNYRLLPATVAALDAVPKYEGGGASGLIDRAIGRLSAEVDAAIEELRAAEWTDEQILAAIDGGVSGGASKLPRGQWRALAVLSSEPLARTRLGG